MNKYLQRKIVLVNDDDCITQGIPAEFNIKPCDSTGISHLERKKKYNLI